MSRAHIKVEANENFTIDHALYRVAEHPALPGIPYVQRGARGFVIQLTRSDGERMALKYFKLKYRVPELVNVAGALRHYADLPGLRAARRTVFTQQSHADLILRYPALEYGMLMPWLPGVTWYDLVTTKAPITPQEGLQLAQETSRILSGIEAQGLAHCDVAGANVMIERQTGQVELVDIEEMYGPDLPKPVETPAGQDGYQHRTSRMDGQWRGAGDRFGAAVLLSEILSWPDGRIRVNSADEHFFATSELQDPDSLRYRLMRETLEKEYGLPVAALLEAAWRSATLDDCPPVAAWHDALSKLEVEARSARPTAFSASPVISGRRAVSLPGGGAPVQPVPGGQALNLEGMRLCRNCGEQNGLNASFCKRCGFYIGSGVHQPRPPVLPTMPPPAPASKPAPVKAPQTVPLNRDLNEVIVARRLGNPGGGMQRVEARTAPAEPVEANAGRWLVIVLLVGCVLAVMLLILMVR
jgi:hypothetical protein